MKSTWLFVGHLIAGQTSLMRMRALRRCGVDVVGFDTRAAWDQQSFIQRRYAEHFERGPLIRKINEELIRTAREVEPDYVWFDKQEYVYPQTLSELSRLGARLVYYTPDPYFTLSWKHTRLMDTCLPMFDLLVTSKTYELAQFSAVGPQCLYVPLGYCDEVHRPVNVPDSNRTTLGFVGGWEPRRQAILEAIAGHGVDVKIWGYAWDHLIDGRWSLRRHLRLKRLAGDDPWQIKKSHMLKSRIVSSGVYSEEYSKALSSSDMSLGFLRTTWPDQHTTRSFEIPACRSMMLADRTDEHLSLFEEGKEAVYFASPEELIEKALYYARRPRSRERIAIAGYERCIRSNYSYVHRMRTILGVLGELV